MNKTRAEPQNKKLEIFLSNGFFVGADDSFEEILALLDNHVVDKDEYIVLTNRDGIRYALRRKDIVGIGEYRNGS